LGVKSANATFWESTVQNNATSSTEVARKNKNQSKNHLCVRIFADVNKTSWVDSATSVWLDITPFLTANTALATLEERELTFVTKPRLSVFARRMLSVRRAKFAAKAPSICKKQTKMAALNVSVLEKRPDARAPN
jgi:hypothetical protein